MLRLMAEYPPTCGARVAPQKWAANSALRHITTVLASGEASSLASRLPQKEGAAQTTHSAPPPLLYCARFASCELPQVFKHDKEQRAMCILARGNVMFQTSPIQSSNEEKKGYLQLGSPEEGRTVVHARSRQVRLPVRPVCPN